MCSAIFSRMLGHWLDFVIAEVDAVAGYAQLQRGNILRAVRGGCAGTGERSRRRGAEAWDAKQVVRKPAQCKERWQMQRSRRPASLAQVRARRRIARR